jgi:serine/threonine protein kinase
MGVVYAAYDRERKARVALKTLSRPIPSALIRLKNEFRELQDLDHPNLVTMGELFKQEEQWFFTMELIDGVDFIAYSRGESSQAYLPVAIPSGLSVQSAQEPTTPDEHPGAMQTEEDSSISAPPPPSDSMPPYFDEDRLRDGLVQLARGLEALHASGRVHRDIKPSNILVSKSGRVVLLDFGLVTQSDPGLLSTEHQVPLGTAAYMAPEQAASQVVGPEADWYAVGVVLYEVLTGRLPFAGPALRVLMAKQDADPPRPREVAPQVPEDLDELCIGMLQRKPSDRPTGANVLGRLAKKTQVVQQLTFTATRASFFVGRKHELDVLFNSFSRLEHEEPANVLVHGASGLGKTELLRTFTRELRSQQSRVVVLHGRCYERETAPFKGFDGIVDDLSRLLRRLPHKEALRLAPRNASLLTRVFPVLAYVYRFGSDPWSNRKVEDLQELRTLAFKALRELFAHLADLYPVVLIIDDLQWADEDSLRLLRAVLQQPEAPTLCLLTTLRTPAEEEAAKKEVQKAAAAFPQGVQELKIGPLSQDEASTLASMLLAGDAKEYQSTAAYKSKAELIGRESAGHPLFLHQLVHHALERPATEEALHLDEVLFARIMSLDPPSRALVELVSVAGGPIQQGTAAKAAGIGLAELSRILAGLRVANLLRTRGMRLGDTIEPYHDRVREAVLARLSPEQRQAWHEKLAQGLRAAGQAEPELLARHLEGAGDSAQAPRCSSVPQGLGAMARTQ